MKTIDEILAGVDRYFDENRPKDAERLLLQSLKEAKEEKKQGVCLQLLNELIGYYRQTSEKEKLLSVIDEAVCSAKEMELEGTTAFATTLVNAANGYRSIGEIGNAKKYYEQAESIYETEAENMDIMVLAGFYNNVSLMYQELQDYDAAVKYLKKALQIVLSQNAGFEIAVTYTNLATTYVAGGKLEESKTYAQKAVAIFRERNCFDAHYAAALSALGMCAYREGKYEQGIVYFEDAMKCVENSVGRNLQYEKLQENRDACIAMRQKKAEEMNGLSLCRQYYETYGKPMITEKFPEYADKIAAGLVGEGSDCFGFDDEISRDHDWGPGFCMWVNAETYQAIGKELQEAYEKLPNEFRGYKVHKTSFYNKRRGVFEINSFYASILGQNPSALVYEACSDAALAAAVNGEVFSDPEGTFTRIREKIKEGYPERLQYLKIAECCALFSQTGQYNFERMLMRGDRLSADRMLADCMGYVMKLCHYLEHKYPPP